MLIAGVFGTILSLILLYVELRWIRQHFERVSLDKADVEIIRDVVDAIKTGNTEKDVPDVFDTHLLEDNSDIDLFFDVPENKNAETSESGKSAGKSDEKGKTKEKVLECCPSFEAKAKKILSQEELEELRLTRMKRDSAEVVDSGKEIMPLDDEYDGFKRRGVLDAEIEDLKIDSKQQKAILAMLEMETRKSAEKIDRLSKRGFANWVKLSFDMPTVNFWFKLYALYTLGSICAGLAVGAFLSNGVMFWVGSFSPIVVYQLAFWATFTYYYTKSNRTHGGGKGGTPK